MNSLDFAKGGGLLPAILFDANSCRVLMLGYMNQEALVKTLNEGKVTFFSRSRNKLWTKGETSGNFLLCKKILADCDKDTLLVYAEPTGPVCHRGTFTCFNEEPESNAQFLQELYELIQTRKQLMPEGSYTTKLFSRGENRIIQKVGEEAIETVIAAKNNDHDEIVNETSDLLFHLLVMLAEKNVTLEEVVTNLIKRHKGA
ncbi:MAG: bifunctional phosphoribosyl-AMP cyclohydrolase/phosphoribosyl-ATP diphosphatase HisIE [Ignavibacteriales bacterium]|nr:bifunctional phosphoribosyl-AMP cyclohydrolase/phosphoribosyl-ATP diphosphatase HisIE [Ignavibacteriales bacterium]